MFRISRRLDYGLQLMIALAAETENKAQSTGSLAKSLSIPLPFLHQIAHTLMQTGYIKATPGPHGGLRLNQPVNSITVLNVVEALEGPVCLNSCQDCGDPCPRVGNCTAQFLWDDLQEKIVNTLASTTLKDLCSQKEKITILAHPFSNGTPEHKILSN